MKSKINYTADVLMNDWHYDVRKIKDADDLPQASHGLAKKLVKTFHFNKKGLQVPYFRSENRRTKENVRGGGDHFSGEIKARKLRRYICAWSLKDK
jgi:hypothetical protein